MIILAGIAAFVGSLLTVAVFSAIFGADRIRRRRHRPDWPYAL